MEKKRWQPFTVHTQRATSKTPCSRLIASQTTGENEFSGGKSKAPSTFSAYHTFKSTLFWVVPVSNVEPQSALVRLWTSSSTSLQQKYIIIPLKAPPKLYSQTVRVPPNIQGAAFKKSLCPPVWHLISERAVIFSRVLKPEVWEILPFPSWNYVCFYSETARWQGTANDRAASSENLPNCADREEVVDVKHVSAQTKMLFSDVARRCENLSQTLKSV